MHLLSISLARLKSTTCTSLPGKKAASATKSRVRVVCPRVGVVRMIGDKPPVFIIADRAAGQRYVIPAKAVNESMIRLLLADRQQESLTVYTDSFRADEPLEADDAFDREYVVHGDGEYADNEVHVNTCESHAFRCDGSSRPIEVFKGQVDIVSQSVSATTEIVPKPGTRRIQARCPSDAPKFNNVLRMSDL